MSPDSRSLRHSACTPALCAGSVVRMNASYDTPMRSAMSRKSAETRSTNACGSTPASWAARSTFWPCSSVPVRKNTSAPSRRCQRAITSAAIEV